MAYGAVKVDSIITSTQEVDVDDLVSTADTAVQPGDIGTAAALDAGTAAGNVPVLDGGGKLTSGVLPSYVDDVLEYANLAGFPVTGETGKIYVALDTNKTYRWSGSTYIEISASPVTSVAGRTGVVTLSDTDISGLGTAATTAATDYATAAQGGLADSAVQAGDLATVATSGSYDDLTDLPTLVEALDDLSDVDLTTTPPADGDALIYDDDAGEWVPGPAGAAAAGAEGEIQFNDGSGGLSASDDLVWDDTGKVLEVGGDVNLDDGGTYTTTLQTVTPTANRTISFPNATGTVGLVAGSSGQLVFNDAGAYAGVSTATVSSGNITLTGRFISSLNGALSATGIAGVPVALTGTWIAAGGTATTTKPQFLIEPTGATSTAWSTSGTGLGVNAASGFAGNLLDLQVNGTTSCRIDGSNKIYFSSSNLTYIAGTSTDLFFETTNNAGGTVRRAQIVNAAEFRLTNGTSLGFSSSNSSSDIFLLREAADTLAQRRTTNANTFRVYNTFTSGTNFERAKLEWDTNVLKVGTEKGADGGTARDMELQTDGTTRITLKANGAILFAGLPTSDPAVAGQLWNDGNTLKISAG